MDQIQRPGEGLDYAAFERVWRRVMPEDRPDCPFTLEPSVPTAPSARAVPAAASLASLPVPPAPAPPPAAAAPIRTGADPTPVPAPPVLLAEAAPPNGRTACLGEESASDLPGLERVLRQTTDDFRIYRTLARRMGQGGLFAALAAQKRRQVRRLTTAAFLISGTQYTAPPTPAPGSLTFPLTLRERFQAEQRAAAGLVAAAKATADSCLAELYRSLAEEDRDFAKRLWARLEQQ